LEHSIFGQAKKRKYYLGLMAASACNGRQKRAPICQKASGVRTMREYVYTGFMKTNTIAPEVSISLQERNAGAKTPRPQHAGPVYRRILLAVDFSPASVPVFEHGLKLAGENGSELLIVHSDLFPSTLSFMPSSSYDEWNAQSRTESKKQIEVFVESARRKGIHCHALALTGFPDDAIVHAAQKLKIDLIVVGAHAHTGISRFFSGSLASRVISHAPCSVLTVRLPPD
jgi:nucleotide-binding universal stress UspA family protein